MTAVSMMVIMSVRLVTANLPEDLLDHAMQVTGKGITETLIEALDRLRRTRAYEKAIALRGRIELDVDLDTSRERRRNSSAEPGVRVIAKRSPD
jgi:hypothetical protein